MILIIHIDCEYDNILDDYLSHKYVYIHMYIYKSSISSNHSI